MDWYRPAVMSASMCALFATIVLTVSTLAGGGFQEAHAYPTPVDFDGTLSRWDIKPGNPPLTYEIISSDQAAKDEYSSAIHESADIWNDIDTSFVRMAPVGPGETAQISIHLESSISGGEHAAGYSQFDVHDKKGPVHCEIYIAVDSTTAYVSFAKTALHEMGHCLGLGHSLIPEAIMSYELDKNTFGLDIDDKAAVSRLYPADGSKPKLPPGCAVGGLSGENGGATTARAFHELLMLFLLPLLFSSTISMRASIGARSNVSGTDTRLPR